MSHGPDPRPLDVVPVRSPSPPRPPRSPLRWVFRVLVAFILVGSLLLNCIALGTLFGLGQGKGGHIIERHYSGKALAHDKVAIINIDGVLMEGMTAFAERQIEKAATDDAVKAVVLHIDSPGGSVTASDLLHHQLLELRDGNPEKKTKAKPIIVSMAGLAASGGYYIAMPGQQIFAEPTTVTGSIGVYAALPNVTALGEKVGFRMEVIRAGEVKDSGSPFKEMTPKERLLWQDMVDRMYLRFLAVVEQGRPQLKGKLQEDIQIDETLPVRDERARQKQVKVTRYRADGGIFLGENALKYGLVDRIGYLEDAVAVAKQAAGLGDDCNIVSYERQATLLGVLLGVQEPAPGPQLELRNLAAAGTPRLWYLAPQSELAGFLAAAGQR